MARRREGPRVLGPYPEERGFRVVVVREDGERDSRFFGTKAEATEVARSLTEEMAARVDAQTTVRQALNRYERYLREDKGNKETSISTTITRLEVFFGADTAPLRSLTPA